jgi:hypothetical protein
MVSLDFKEEMKKKYLAFFIIIDDYNLFYTQSFTYRRFNLAKHFILPEYEVGRKGYAKVILI